MAGPSYCRVRHSFDLKARISKLIKEIPMIDQKEECIRLLKKLHEMLNRNWILLSNEELLKWESTVVKSEQILYELKRRANLRAELADKLRQLKLMSLKTQ